MEKDYQKVVQATNYPHVRIVPFVQWPISLLHLNLNPSDHLKFIFLLMEVATGQGNFCNNLGNMA